MKNKFLGLVMLFLFIFTMSINNVNAEVLTWDTIVADYKKIIEDEKYVITSDDTSLNISYEEFEVGPYSIKIDYDDTNKKISYISTRDTTNFTDKQKVEYGSYDAYFLAMLVLDLSKLYNIDLTKYPNDLDDKIIDYGIDLDGDDVEYVEKDKNGSITTSVTYINKFTMDLNKFDQATSSIQNTATDTKAYDLLTIVLKGLLQPISDKIDSADSNDLDWDFVEDIINGEDYETTDSDEQEVVKEDTTTEKNPKTGIEKIGIPVVIIGTIALITYIIIRNKKLLIK